MSKSNVIRLEQAVSRLLACDEFDRVLQSLWEFPAEEKAAKAQAILRALSEALNYEGDDTGRPSLVALDPDDFIAKYVGVTSENTQFFLTTSFDADTYLVLYQFDLDGNLISHKIENTGSPDDSGEKKRDALRQQWLSDLGAFKYQRIKIKPFEVEYCGIRFGFIAQEFEDNWFVEVEPGNYMAFHYPWDSGHYDT